MKETIIVNQKLNKETLFKNLVESNIKINDYAKLIFNHPEFKYTNSEDQINIVQLKLSDIGLKNGGNFEQVERAMKSNNFDFCPLEFAPYIRMHFHSQKSSRIITKNQHPPDSILIFSKPLIIDDDFPKGFYIRNIENTLWLRGYICSMDYYWESGTEIILKKKSCI